MTRKKKHGKVRSPLGGEHWTKMLRTTMETPAWTALSCTAQALYPWIKFEWRGVAYNNNGKLRLSIRQAAARLGVVPDTAAEAFRDLQRKGFIVQTEAACLGIEGTAKAPAYEITELKMPLAEGDGRKLYSQWSPGNDFPVAGSSPNNPGGRNGRKTKPCHENQDDPVLKTMTKRDGPVLETMTACPKNHDENAILTSSTVLKTMTSLSYHRGGGRGRGGSVPSKLHLTAASGPGPSPQPNGGQAPRARAKAEKRAAAKDIIRTFASGLAMPGGEHG